MTVFQFMWRAAAGRRLLWLCAFLNFFLIAGLYQALISSIKWLVDALSHPHFVWYALVACGLHFVVNIAHRVNDWLQLQLVPYTKNRVEQLAFEHLLIQQYRFFQHNFVGSLAAKVKDLQEIPYVIWMVLGDFLFTGVMVVTSFYALCQVNLYCAVLFIIWAVAFVGWVLAGLGRFQEFAIIQAQEKAVVTGVIADVMTNMLGVKLFASQTAEHSYVNAATASYTRVSQQQRRFLLQRTTVQSVGFAVYQGLSLFLLVWLRLQGKVTVGDFALVLSLNTMLNDQLWRVSEALRDFFDDWGQLKAALDTLYSLPILQDGPDARPRAGSDVTLRVENLFFSYGPRAGEIAIDYLVIPTGQRVGLVGASGGGKSTFLSLLLRFYDPQAGSIYLGGQALEKITRDSLHKAIAFVPQDPSLFHRSIFENIAYGAHNATFDEVRVAAQRACADDFILQLPHGYETIVGERGTKLSGGQRQRIVLARAFLKKAPILLLDEATSALDTITEKQIVLAGSGQTVIAVAHRLSTVASFDRILVFEAGRIVQDGSPEELRRRPGLYKALWDLQQR